MSATTSHAARPTRRRPATRPPRRVSGPSSRTARRPSAGGAVAVGPPLALRLGRRAARIVDARFLDRLLRGRVWIALLALGLMGIVFIQVSMLRLNAGVSRAVTSAETLHRQNATLRADLSKLDSSERIGDAAKSFGMIQPQAGSVRYLDARKANAAAAARRIRPPKPPVQAQAPATATTVAPVPQTTTTTPPTQTAPVVPQTQAQAPAATTAATGQGAQ
jgi:hypothetical protein